MIAVLFMIACQAFSVMYLQDGGTWNIQVGINDSVYVDYIASGNPTTVNLMEGGGVYNLETYNQSQITMSSGSYVVGNLNAYNSSHVTMNGGSVWYFTANENSQVTMNGGSVGYKLDGNGSSQITLTGGMIDGRLDVTSSNQTNWYGGTIGDYIRVNAQAILTIHGSNFAIDGTPVDFGEIFSLPPYDSFGNQHWRILTGTLANGDMINNQFKIGDDVDIGAKIILIPEPATLLLLGLGGLVLTRRRR